MMKGGTSVDNLQEIRDQLRQAEQNFNYVDQEYIDAAIYELKAVNEKFRAMLREKRREKSGQANRLPNK